MAGNKMAPESWNFTTAGLTGIDAVTIGVTVCVRRSGVGPPES